MNGNNSFFMYSAQQQQQQQQQHTAPSTATTTTTTDLLFLDAVTSASFMPPMMLMDPSTFMIQMPPSINTLGTNNIKSNNSFFSHDIATTNSSMFIPLESSEDFMASAMESMGGDDVAVLAAAATGVPTATPSNHETAVASIAVLDSLIAQMDMGMATGGGNATNSTGGMGVSVNSSSSRPTLDLEFELDALLDAPSFIPTPSTNHQQQHHQQQVNIKNHHHHHHHQDAAVTAFPSPVPTLASSTPGSSAFSPMVLQDWDALSHSFPNVLGTPASSVQGTPMQFTSPMIASTQSPFVIQNQAAVMATQALPMLPAGSGFEFVYVQQPQMENNTMPPHVATMSPTPPPPSQFNPVGNILTPYVLQPSPVPSPISSPNLNSHFQPSPMASPLIVPNNSSNSITILSPTIQVDALGQSHVIYSTQEFFVTNEQTQQQNQQQNQQNQQNLMVMNQPVQMVGSPDMHLSPSMPLLGSNLTSNVVKSEPGSFSSAISTLTNVSAVPSNASLGASSVGSGSTSITMLDLDLNLNLPIVAPTSAPSCTSDAASASASPTPSTPPSTPPTPSNNLDVAIPSTSTTPPPRTPGQNACTTCSRTFATAARLKCHIRTHQRKRLHPCLHDPPCQKTFFTKQDQSRHMETHRGLRRFSCPGCGFGFVRGDALKRHVKAKGCVGLEVVDEVVRRVNGDGV
ncbi:hypothetical protein HDU97_004961 [Phlyctochytrium planicorne]|nr:hypothetical protein HDU97_004961 [Phlyctochytrium planicorne]